MGIICAVVFAMLGQLGFSTVYVNNSASGATPTGSAIAPFQSLAEALSVVSDTALDLVLMSAGSRMPYDLRTVGLHSKVGFQCDNATIAVAASLLIGVGVSVSFDACEVLSHQVPRQQALFVVFGTVDMSNCAVHSDFAKIFVVYGMISLLKSVFANNYDSVIAATTFGFVIYVQSCTFDSNLSPVGAVILLSISNSAPISSSELVFNDCSVTNNRGLMGGAFMYLNVNRNIQFSSQQMIEKREFVVRNCFFQRNAGYANLIFSKFVNTSFVDDTFVDHDSIFVLQLFDSSFSITNSSISTLSFLVIITHISGHATFASLNISNLLVGPVFLIRNSAAIDCGTVFISDVDLHDVHNSTATLLSPSILAYAANIKLQRLRVHGGRAFAGICGCYSFCGLQFGELMVEGLTLTGAALFVMILSQAVGVVTDVRNITMTGGAMITAYYSNLTVSSLHFEPGETGYLLVPKPRYNICAAFDSVVSMTRGEIVLPEIENYPAFYLWKSVLLVEQFRFGALFSTLIQMFANSEATIRDVSIGNFEGKNVAVMSFFSKLAMSNITADRLHAESSLISAFSYSEATVSHFVMKQANLMSLVIASHSDIRMKDIVLTQLRADTLFWYISDSNITVWDLSVTNSVFDLMQLTSSSISFHRVSMENVTVRRRFMSLSQSAAEFHDFRIFTLQALTIFPLCVSKRSSKITFVNSSFVGIRSREQGLVSITDSSISFHSTSISDFNITFFTGLRADFTFNSSSVRMGGLKLMDTSSKARVTAGLLDCVDCKVEMIRSSFSDLSGTNGGVLAARRYKMKPVVNIFFCEFEGNTAEKTGGSIAAVLADVVISSSKFVSGKANSGGAIYFECQKGQACTCDVSFSRFISNVAKEGGAVKWTQKQPNFTVCSNENNTAVYGPFEASLPTYTTLLNSNNSTLRGVPGVVVVEPILIGFVDVIGQLVATDNSSSAELVSTQIVGTNYLIAVNGVANFSGVIVRTKPGTTVPIEVVSASINRTFPGSSQSVLTFWYETRVCVMGEVTTSEGCYLCPKNTFSVDPTESECRECPSYATCPGSSALVLDKGYWRPSETRSDVYLCLVRESCLGGRNATCSEGYTSRLCSACDTGYYSGGLAYCFQCESALVRSVRAIILFFATMLVWMLVARKCASLHGAWIGDFNLTTYKILLAFLTSLLPVSLIVTDLQPGFTRFLSVNEMIQSFGLSSLTLECVLDSTHGLSPVFLKAIFASAYPFAVGFLVFTVLAACSYFTGKKLPVSRYCEPVLILTHSLHTYVLKATVMLVACKKVESYDSYLLADPQVQCWDSEHRKMFAAFVMPVFVIYLLAYPALLVHIVAKKYTSDHFTFLRCGLKLECYYWEVMVFLRKTALVVFLSFVNVMEIQLQVIPAVMLLYISLEHSLRASPYSQPAHNRLDLSCQFLILSLYASTFYFSPNLHAKATILTAASLCTIGLLSLVCIWALAMMIIRVRSSARTDEARISKNESDMSAMCGINPPPTSLACNSLV